jgi:hypothetical protein
LSENRVPRDAENRWQAAIIRFAKYIDETETLVRLHTAGVSRLIGVPNFLKEAFYESEDSEWFISAKRLADVANTEASKEFPLLHAHSLLGLWSALEALVEDVSVAWIMTKPETLQRPAFSKIRVSIVEFQLLTTEEQMRYLVAEAQRDLKAELRLGITRFEKLLDAIGMNGSTPNEVSKAIYEAQQVRNAIAHRGGLADRQLTQACPWLGLNSGERIVIGHRKFKYYLQAIHLYILGINNRFRVVEGKKPIEYDRAVLTELTNQAALDKATD